MLRQGQVGTGEYKQAASDEIIARMHTFKEFSGRPRKGEVEGIAAHLEVHLLHEVAQREGLPVAGHGSAHALLVVDVHRALLQLLQPKLPARAKYQHAQTPEPLVFALETKRNPRCA